MAQLLMQLCARARADCIEQHLNRALVGRWLKRAHQMFPIGLIRVAVLLVAHIEILEYKL
jgi:hypothetical protein